MKKIILIAVLLFFKIIYSQEIGKTITVGGKVVEKKTAAALGLATITFINSLDGKSTAGSITDGKGNFSLKIAPGKYNIKAEFIGLESNTIENFDLQNDQILPTFLLDEIPTEVETVEIQAEKTTIEHKLDKRSLMWGVIWLQKAEMQLIF